MALTRERLGRLERLLISKAVSDSRLLPPAFRLKKYLAAPGGQGGPLVCLLLWELLPHVAQSGHSASASSAFRTLRLSFSVKTPSLPGFGKLSSHLSLNERNPARLP